MPSMRVLFYGCLAGVSLTAVVEASQVLVGLNLHTVIPGRVYRCAQPSPNKLERLVHAHGIRTVLNLRGPNPDQSWYRGERAARIGGTAEIVSRPGGGTRVAVSAPCVFSQVKAAS